MLGFKLYPYIIILFLQVQHFANSAGNNLNPVEFPKSEKSCPIVSVSKIQNL